MTRRCVPMIHVPDVRATVEWYQSIGFSVVETFDDGGNGLSFAVLSFGDSEVMFNGGGRPSTLPRREVDLYVYSENVDALYESLKDRVDVVDGPHDTFYGMREVIVRDLNRFWVTFGEVGAGAMLMTAVDHGNADGVRAALRRGGLTPERLSAALADASRAGAGEIVALLGHAGAVAPLAVDVDLLRGYTGTYKSEEGIAVRITLENGALVALPDEGHAVRLLPADPTVFKPLDLADATVTFRSGDPMGLTFTQGSRTMRFTRIAGG